MARDAEVDASALFDIVQPVPHALECPICRGPLADPVQTPTCQHLFCRACLARSLSLARSCPIDRSPLDSVHNCEPAPRAVRELLDDLTVRCLRGNGACGKEMRRDEWDRHALECRMPGERAEDVKGKSAGVEQGKDSYEEKGTDGTERCELCDVEVLSSELQTHLSTCPSSRQPCTHCSLNLPLASHPSHLLNSCPSVPLPCPHAPHGCTYAGPRTHLYDDHLPSECAYEPLKTYFENQDRRTRELEGENWELKNKVVVLERRLEGVERLLEGLRDGMGGYFPADEPSSASASSKPSPASSSSPTLASTLSALSSTTSTLSSTLSSLSHSHHQHLSTTHHVVDELAALRAGLAGVRIQVGGVMMEMQRVAASGGGAMMIGRRAGEAEDDRDGDTPGASGHGAPLAPPFFRSRTMPYPPLPPHHAHASMYGGSAGLDYAGGGMGAQGARGLYSGVYGVGVGGGSGMGPLSPGALGGAGVKL